MPDGTENAKRSSGLSRYLKLSQRRMFFRRRGGGGGAENNLTKFRY